MNQYPGIMNYGDVQFQLIEAPAVMEGASDGDEASGQRYTGFSTKR